MLIYCRTTINLCVFVFIFSNFHHKLLHENQQKCMVESINVIVDDLGSRSRESDEDIIDVSKDIKVMEEKSKDEKLSENEEKKEEQGNKGDKGRIEPSKKNKSRVPKNHPLSNVIGNYEDSMVTRRQSKLNKVSYVCYTSQIEQKMLKKP